MKCNSNSHRPSGLVPLLNTIVILLSLHNRALPQKEFVTEDSLLVAESDSVKSSLTLLPAIFYTPETKLGFGVYPNYIFRFSKESNPSNLSFLAYYTINKQISLSFDPNLYIKNDNYFLSGSLEYTKWPNSFYGFGTGVNKDSSEDYTTRNSGIYLEFMGREIGSLYAGVAYELAYTKFLELEQDGKLLTENISGVNDGYIAGTGLIVNWDARDNIFYPGEGEYIYINSMYYGSDLGGDYTYNRLIVDLRKYYSTHNNVIAAQLYGRFIKGNAPFREYSQIGDVIRGYLPALYIEKKLAAAQIEYRRVPVIGRFGLTLFAGAGSVARTIPDFKSERLKFAAGFGIRYLLVKSEKLNIRVDYGIGDNGAELYLDAGEAF